MAEVRVSKAIGVLLIFLTVLRFEVQSSILQKEEIKLSRLKRSEPVKTCFEMVSECRKNATCLKSYRTVKRKCTFFRQTCRAPTTFHAQCFKEITILKEVVFKEKCDCFNNNYIMMNKIQKCMDIENMIFVNPCYDFIATTEKHVNSAAGDHGLGNDVLGQKSPNERNTMSDSNIKNLRPPKSPIEPTEEELKRLDELFAINDEKPHEARSPIVFETPILDSNDVNNGVSDNGKFEKEPPEQEKNLNFANANKRPFASQITQPVTLLPNDDSNDVNTEDEESKRPKMTDVNASELDQVVATLVNESYKTDGNNDVDGIEEKSEEKLSESDRISFDQSSSNVNNDKVQQQSSALNIVFIVLGSVILVVATLGTLLYFKRAKRTDYARGKCLAKSCQSAIIIKPIFEDSDRNVKRKINRV